MTKDLVQQEDSLQEAMLFQWYMSNVHHSILSKMTSIYPKYILSYLMRLQTIMRGLLPPDKQHQAEDRALQDAEEEAEIFEMEVNSINL